ncbi:MAG: hypothetical protein NTX25_01065, partial [Proteobacteria bacterium]|nr:hypothetical protein [Pseudomonadota bacterium]
PATAAYYEFTAMTGSTTTPLAHLVPRNSSQSWWTDSWNSSQAIGKIYPGTNASGGALLRGASWYNGALAGLFAAYLDYAASNAGSGVGFRCAWQP